jgi:hypothetical protein
VIGIDAAAISAADPKALYLVEHLTSAVCQVTRLHHPEVARSEAKRRASSHPVELWQAGARVEVMA